MDWKSLGLTDYPQIITRPMDLRTLKSNFDKGKYFTATEVAEDTRLIFTNAMTYNAPGSKIYAQANSLGDFFESSWAKLLHLEDPNRLPTSDELKDFVEKCHR